MGESLINALEVAKNVLHLDAIPGKLTELVNMLPAPILEFYNNHSVIFFMVVAAFLALLAFEGYKIFKMLLFTGSAIGFGILGYWYVAPMVPETIKAYIPEIVEVNVLIAVALAFVGLFLCKVAQPFMIMILGGITGYLMGSTFVYALVVDYFNTLDFLKADAVKHIVGGAIAALMVLIFLLFFKHLYIVITSFGGTIGAALILQSIVLPAADDSMKICFVILAIALGIFALTRQYQEEEKAMELVF